MEDSSDTILILTAADSEWSKSEISLGHVIIAALRLVDVRLIAFSILFSVGCVGEPMPRNEREIAKILSEMGAVVVTDADGHITEAHLHDCTSPDLAAQQLKLSLFLVHLSAPNCDLGNEGMNAIVTCRNLRELDVSLTCVTGDGFKRIDSLENLEQLSTTVSGGLGSLGQLKSLRRLDLAASGVTDADMSELRQLTSLRDLSLNDTVISDEGVKNLGASFAGERLSIEGTRITDKSAVVISQISSIKKLNVARTHLTDAGVCLLCKLPYLTELNLSGTQITDDVAIYLRKCTELVAVNMYGTRLTPAVIEELGKIQALEYVSVPSERFDEVDASRLQSLLPEAYISRLP